MKRGKFVSFEGIEGVGKSSNIDVFVGCIEAAGHQVITTREPGGTPLAEEVRSLLVDRTDEAIPEIAELLLMFAARAISVNNVIRPALDAGTWVVCDRFTDSSRAYQGAGRGLPMETIDQVADWVHGDIWPELTVLLDAPVEVGLQRASKRGAPDRIEREEVEFFGRVRDCYLQLAEREPARFAVIDTRHDLASVNTAVAALAAQLLSNV